MLDINIFKPYISVQFIFNEMNNFWDGNLNLQMLPFEYEEFMLMLQAKINPNLQFHSAYHVASQRHNSDERFGMIHNPSGKYICFCHAASIKLPIG